MYRRLPWRLQDLLVTLSGAGRWRHESGVRFQRLVSSLMSSQHADREGITDYQKGRLTSVLIAARSTEYYSKLLPSEEAIRSDPFAVLASVPVLCKDQVRSDFLRFRNPSYSGRLLQHGTSGTTGTPLQTIWTRESMDMERALVWRQRRQTGLEFGREWRGMLGGHQIVPLEQRTPPYWRTNRLAKQVYLSTYHLSSATAPHYLDAMKEFGIRTLEGYPSVLYAMASSFHQCGLRFPLNGIYFGAEPLLDFQRKLIEHVFICYAWDYYGLTERVASASEFECRNGLHENWENSILEIVDPSGNPVDEGNYGELVGTSLSNLGFPLLRYRTGDMTRFLPGSCTCGRSSRRIAGIDTKREDLLLMPDGSLLSASNLTFPFKEVDHILESQLYQDSVHDLQVRIVPAPEYNDGDGAKLLSGLRRILPDSVRVELVLVPRISRSLAGKFRFCISTLTGGADC